MNFQKQIQLHRRKKRMKKSEESLPDACNTMKRNTIYIMEMTEGKKEKGTKSVCKTIMPESFPTWKKK